MTGRYWKSIRWIVPFLLLLAGTACAFPGRSRATPTLPRLQATSAPTAKPTAQPTATPRVLPPAVIESDPPTGAELPLNGPITLYFNQPMERGTVEAVLRQQFPQGGTFTWLDNATLVFYPDEALSPASEVRFGLDESVLSADGQPIFQPISYAYQTVDYLRPVQILPEPDAQDIDPTSAIVAAFNYPVVPLGESDEDLPAAFSLEPAADGHGEWLNSSTYVFYPQPALVGGQAYSVSINPDLVGLDGSPLEAMSTWQFTTAQPELVMVEPDPVNQLLRLDGTVALTFNQPMDKPSLEANFALVDANGEPVVGEFTWNEDATRLEFIPVSLLQRDTAYQVEIGLDARSAAGAPLVGYAPVTLFTYPSLFVTYTEPGEGGVLHMYNSAIFYFSAPLPDKDLMPYVSIRPEVADLTLWRDESTSSLYIHGSLRADTNYALRLSPNLPDAWGGTLGEEFVLNLKTSPLMPDLAATVYSPALTLRTSDPGLLLQAANLPSVRLSRSELSLEDLIWLLGPDGYQARLSYIQQDPQVWTQPVNAPATRTVPVEIPLTPKGRSLPPGMYYLKAVLPKADDPERYFVVVVSDVQVTFKFSATDALVWAVNLADFSPVANTPVTIYDEEGAILVNGMTGTDGVYQAELPVQSEDYHLYTAVVGEPGEASFGMASSSWDVGLQPWEFGLPTDYSPPHLKVYFYSDRPIYRPGQTVYFRMVARQAYNGRYSLPDLASLPVEVFNDMGERVSTFDLPISAYGTAHGKYLIPADARPGSYSMTIPELTWDSLYFQVAEYRKPEIDLQVSLAPEQVKIGEDLLASIETRYFFGAPAGNLPIKWTLYVTYDDFVLPGYQVGLADTRWLSVYPFTFPFDPLGWYVSEGQGMTDAQGKFSLRLPAKTDQLTSGDRLRFTLEVSAADESGLPVSARDYSLANPEGIYIGVRPEAWFGQAGESLPFDLLVADWEGKPVGGRDVNAELLRVEWLRQDPPADRPYEDPTYTPEYTPVDQARVITDNQGAGKVTFVPPDPGTYQLNLTAGNARTEIMVWVGGSGQAVWPSLPNKRLSLIADRANYQPRETARVFVPNPFGVEVPALITIERGKVLRYELVNLAPQGSDLSLPLSSEDAPNVFLSVTVIGEPSKGLPDFRQGYLILSVAPEEQALQISLTSQPSVAGPGDEVVFEFQVTDSAGEPVQGEFSLAVADLAALALADPNSPDILPAFYGTQGLGVRTSTALSVFARQTAASQAGGMGGGGGDFIGTVLRESFPDTAYWNAELITDAQGRGSVSLTLPDSLTTWRADLRGVTDDTRVGQVSTDIVTTRDLLVRPVTPRFFIVGDHAQVAAVVQNNTAEAMRVNVALDATGFLLDEMNQAAQEIELPAGGRARVEWWGTVQDVTGADMIFSAESLDGAYQDATRPAFGILPVLRYTARQAYRTAGTLDEGGERLELVSLPRSFDPDSGELKIELTSSLGAAMIRALDALEENPYQCTEPTLSSFLPALEVYNALQQFDLGTAEIKEQLDQSLADGLQYLYASQNEDGGWGWCQGSDSDPLISSYLLFGLARAQQVGIDVDQGAMEKAIDYLNARQPSLEKITENWELDRLAFQAFALSEAGSPPEALVEDLFARQERLSAWARAMLALSFESLVPGSSTARTLLSDLQTAAQRSASGAHWELENPAWSNLVSPLSNSAMVVYALAQRDPAAPLLADAVRYLMAQRRVDGAWESSFASAWTLMALSEFLIGTGELGGDFSYGASVNGTPIASGQAGGVEQLTPVTASLPLTDLYPDDPNALEIQRSAGNGRLYYTADLLVSRPVADITPLSQGLSIERAYFPAEDCPRLDCPAIKSAESGQKVVVRLTLILPHDLYHVVVEDPFPAGMEAQDPNLKTTQLGEGGEPQAEQVLSQFDPADPYSAGWGWWNFHPAQLFDDRIAWTADYLPAGTYQLSYTLLAFQPGEYRVLPARAWQFYFPDVQANSTGEVFEVK